MSSVPYATAAPDAQPKRQLVFNAFVMNTPGHLSPGQWKFPGDRAREFATLKYWTNLAKLAEKGRFNAIFIADVLGGYDVYNGNLDAALRTGAQFPVHDPFQAISAMAAVTKNLAFGITQSTTYEAPFTVARRYSTLDHLTQGRVAINVVTSYLDSAARNHGLKQQLQHSERYERAHEYLEVLYKLWEFSWRDDAKVLDVEKDLYYVPERVREINHKGKFFNVSGPHIVEPSPQRTPLIFQAGSSGPGLDFAVRHAEAIFVSGSDPRIVRKRVDTVRAGASKIGRDPRSVKAVAGITVILGRTAEEAKAKLEAHRKVQSIEGALVLLGGWTGNDLGIYNDDEELRLVESNAVKSTIETYSNRFPDVPKWTKARIAQHVALGGNSPALVGTPESVADELERWVEVGDVDGFNFGYIGFPSTFEDIVELLFPELERRGLHRADFPATKDGEPLTARENYFGVGQKHLRDDHVGAQYKWRIPEQVDNGAGAANKE